MPDPERWRFENRLFEKKELFYYISIDYYDIIPGAMIFLPVPVFTILSPPSPPCSPCLGLMSFGSLLAIVAFTFAFIPAVLVSENYITFS